MPYVKEENAASVLRQSKNEEAAYGDTSMSYSEKEEMTAVIPVLAYTEKVPVLREKYAALDYYELVHFIPVSLWKEIKGQIGGIEEDSYICVLGKENGSLEELKMLQEEIGRIVSGKYTIECENRIQEYETNSKQIQGMMAVFGGQRKREFARYMSVGLTPKDLRKMFCIEALVISGRPILISLPLVIIATGYMLKISYVEVRAFMAEMPLIPILLFMLAILGSVTLAYYLAWRNVQKISLEEVLRDDRMM